MHKTPLILTLVLWILGGALWAAQLTKPRPAAKLRSACELITKAEIEQATGTPVSAGFQHKDEKANAESCAFKQDEHDTVGVLITRSNDKRDLSVLVAKTKEALPEAKVRELPGLGQKAILADDPKIGTMLSVYRGGDALVVSVTLTGKGVTADAAAETIARKAFKRF